MTEKQSNETNKKTGQSADAKETRPEKKPETEAATIGKPAASQKNSKVKKQKSQQASSSLLILSVLALAIAGSSGLGSYWVYQQQRKSLQLQNDNLQQSAASLRRSLESAQSEIRQLKNQQTALDSKSESMGSEQLSLNSSLEQLRSQLKALAEDQGRDPLLWRAAEVRYLLSVANHRLVMERDVATAKVALDDADRRLQAIADPSLIPVREKVAGEINALNALSLPDLPGLAAQIQGLQQGLEQLPVLRRPSRYEPHKSTTQEAGQVKNFFTDVFGSLFRIRRSDQPIQPLLPPDEEQFLWQNLNLKLEQARLSLMRQDTEAFRQNLNEVQHWLTQYFDRESSSVAILLDQVQSLQTIELQPALPDISASLRELTRWIRKQGGDSLSQVGLAQPRAKQRKIPAKSTASAPVTGNKSPVEAVLPGETPVTTSVPQPDNAAQTETTP